MREQFTHERFGEVEIHGLTYTEEGRGYKLIQGRDIVCLTRFQAEELVKRLQEKLGHEAKIKQEYGHLREIFG